MRRTLIFCCAAVLLTLPVTLFAAGNINFGNLKVIPGIEFQGVYDDNIYMKNGTDTPTDRTNKKVADMIYHVKPGILLNYTLPERGNIMAGWSGDWALYNTEDRNNWKNNTFNLGVDYRPPSGLILDVREAFGFKEDPFGGPNQYAVGRVTKRWENDLNAKAGVAWGNNTFRTLLLYNNHFQKYVSDYDFAQNYKNNEFGLSAEARFLPKTWGFVRYLYGIQTYDSFNGAVVDGVWFPGVADNRKADFKHHSAYIGANWDPGAKLSGEVAFGYLWKRYDNPLDRLGNAREDRNTWVASTNVNWEATATTTVSLNIARTLRDQSSDSYTYFEDTGIGLNLRQKILSKFEATAGFNYSMNDYNSLPAGYAAGDKRQDKNYLFNLGLDYLIQEWLTVGVGYKHNKKTSNYQAFEFDDNQFMANLKIVY